MAEVEIGILSNPIIFTGVVAGQITPYPNNPIYLWNDKGGTSNSVDARQVTLSVLELSITDELIGYSDGSPVQTFIVAYYPVIENDTSNPLIVKVNGIIWLLVPNLSPYSNTDQVYTFDFSTGTVTFGDGVNGMIPTLGGTIEVSYTPNKVEFGLEMAKFNWLEIRSNGVLSNPRSVLLERQISIDASHITASHVPITSVGGVWLNSDPGRFGTNYYTGGSFDVNLGSITLGTSLPHANETILIDYVYTIKDDLEATYSPIGQITFHTFFNPIPSNNAKKIYLQINPPETTSPTGIMNIQFRIRLDLKA